MAHSILPLELQIPSLVVLGLFLAWVLRLIRTHRLSLRDSLVWLLSTVSAVIVTAFPSLLADGAGLLGILVPANALFGVGLLYLALNVLAITLTTSTNADRVRRLAQECALLRAEIDTLRHRSPAGDPVSTARREPTS